MSRSSQPVRRRRRRGQAPVLVVLVGWIVLFLSVLGLATLLVLDGMAVSAVVSSVAVLVAAAATASTTLIRSALAAAAPRNR